MPSTIPGSRMTSALSCPTVLKSWRSTPRKSGPRVRTSPKVGAGQALFVSCAMMATSSSTTRRDNPVLNQIQAVPGSFLRCQDDGNLVIYTPDMNSIWASHTHSRPLEADIPYPRRPERCQTHRRKRRSAEACDKSPMEFSGHVGPKRLTVTMRESPRARVRSAPKSGRYPEIRSRKSPNLRFLTPDPVIRQNKMLSSLYVS